MLNSKNWILGMILVASAAALVACAQHGTAREDIYGIWVEKPLDAGRVLTICATLEFYPNGTFKAHNIPLSYFADSAFHSRISTSGRWELQPRPKDPFAWQVIHLEFGPNEEGDYRGGFATSIYISAEGNSRVLFQWKGDESDRITFAKQDSTDCR